MSQLFPPPSSSTSEALLPYCFCLQHARLTDPEVQYLYNEFLQMISTISHPRHAQTVDVKLTPSVERQPRRPSLVDFPDEILRLIFESLPWQATVQSSMVCQEWYHLCSEERVWKQYCLICFDVSLDSFNICESLSAKELFRNIHLQMTHIITPHAGVQQTHCSLPLAWQPLLFND